MNKTDTTKLTLNTDGGSRNNPGKAAIGFVVRANDEILASEKKFIGIATNNEAEYQAMLSGVQYVKNFYPECDELVIYSDSELMVKQLRGEYKIREMHLKTYADAIKELFTLFKKVHLNHILRGENKLADKLVNQALDEQG